MKVEVLLLTAGICGALAAAATGSLLLVIAAVALCVGALAHQDNRRASS